MSQTITTFEGSILMLISRCGGSRVDLSGTRINARAKEAAIECCRKGLLSGEPWQWSLTNEGRDALKRIAA